jgi:hypothetical protein
MYSIVLFNILVRWRVGAFVLVRIRSLIKFLAVEVTPTLKYSILVPTEIFPFCERQSGWQIDMKGRSPTTVKP